MLRKLLKKIIKKIQLHEIIDELQIENKLVYFKNNVTNRGATFNPEAEVNNLAADKTKINIGTNTHIRGELTIWPYSKGIEIGENSYIGKGTVVRAGEKITIGDNVLIAHNVTIIDSDSHEIEHNERAQSFKQVITYGHPLAKGNVKTGPIIIENFVWISYGVCVLKGVTIGKGAIVGAGSVVTKNIDPFTLVAGNPAKVIKSIPQN